MAAANEATQEEEEGHHQHRLQQDHHHPQTPQICHRPLSRAARQLFRRDAYPILIHHFGQSPWRRLLHNDDNEDFSVDKLRRKRKRISLVEDSEDNLTDEEWYALLSYAIDNSPSNSNNNLHGQDGPVCPLHPKNDVLLFHEQNSYLIHRRYRTGAAVSKYGGLSLPLLGRSARAALWLEDRQFYGRNGGSQQIQQWAKKHGNSASDVYLFQCGICEKTFLSRYYLDKHMEAHHRDSLTTQQEHEHSTNEINSGDTPFSYSSNKSPDATLLCPAESVCNALGGISACAEMMNQMFPYYGRGTLLGKEYIIPSSDSLFASSIHSLISRWYHGDEEPSDNLASSEEDLNDLQNVMKKKKKMREGNFVKVAGEMRHRGNRRNQLLFKALQHKQLDMQQFIEEDFLLQGANVNDETGIKSDDSTPWKQTSPTSCNEEEMNRRYQSCRKMMTDCFGDTAANIDDSNDEHTLPNDLVSHICEPLHCHHRLHRMAGHTPLHILQWSDEWEEYHSFSLGFFGWIVVIGIAIFYVCVFALGLGGESSLLPRYGRKRKNKTT